MTRGRRKISKEIYDRSKNYNGFITTDDERQIFTISELCGYGVYGARAVEEDGEYYVAFSLGSSCD